MKKHNIVKKKYEFEKVIKNGRILKSDYYIIYFKKNDLNNFRFGISVGTKLGNAVFRNKYKRKIRNIIDNNKKYYQNKMDYIIIMRKKCTNLSFNEMEKEFVNLIKNKNKGENNEK